MAVVVSRGIVYPDYKKSILNLVSSILKVYDYDSEYPPLSSIDVDSCKNVKNIILLVIDGLGQKYTKACLPYLNSKMIDTASTVFPATTASAILSYYTGMAPNQHGCTGWFTYLPEINGVATMLPFNHRGDKKRYINNEIDINEIFPRDGYLFDKIKGVDKHVIVPSNLQNNPISKFISRDACRHFFNNKDHMIAVLKSLIKTSERKFIFAYFSDFDAICHKNGVKSRAAFDCINDFSDSIMHFEEELLNNDSRLLISSDHGFLDTADHQVVFLHHHQDLERCLKLPLAGDSRVKNCRLRAGCEKKFLDYIGDNLSDKVDVYSRQEILERNFYGPGNDNPKFIERIGDYILITKNNHILLDFMPNEDFEHFNLGNHSGISEDEMLVPVLQLGV